MTTEATSDANLNPASVASEQTLSSSSVLAQPIMWSPKVGTPSSLHAMSPSKRPLKKRPVVLFDEGRSPVKRLPLADIRNSPRKDDARYVGALALVQLANQLG